MIIGACVLMFAGAVFLVYATIQVRSVSRSCGLYRGETPCLTVAQLVEKRWVETLRDIHDLPERTP
jgi:hypothetical protein